ncbi:MAG: HlyD family secretion protein [Halioglobus sp.]
MTSSNSPPLASRQEGTVVSELPETKQPNAGRKASIALVSLIALLAFGFWVYQRATHVYTDDARIASRMIEISAESAGQLVAYPIVQGQPLAEGDLIAQIDSDEAQFVLAELSSELQSHLASYQQLLARMEQVEQSTGGRLQAAQSRLQAALASQQGAKFDLELKQIEWERAQTLLERKIISEQDWEAARNVQQQADQYMQRAVADVSSARASVMEAKAEQAELDVLAQELLSLEHEQNRVRARISRQQVLVNKLKILAPESGIVDKSFVEKGEYVLPGQRIVLIHNPDKIWVAANIKETEIRHIQLGTRANLQVDGYPDMQLEGEVYEIGGAATSQFSLLPSSNPSGNFTKVTQRIPIKISIEQEGQQLRPGMMVEVALVLE